MRYQIMCSSKNMGWHVEKCCIRELADFGTHPQKGCPPQLWREFMADAIYQEHCSIV